ncbi:MAG TPA: exodeoxyribonuclease VII small subunit [Acidimicrobiia bacterium]|nr:exodeoxyribonuclease VII small subunit [Acidimicrobiia bacterium]
MTDDEPTTGYAEAIGELEDILEELEGDQLDVDVLAERVRRASELVKVCRERITRAQADVDAIVAELDEFEAADPDADTPADELF